MNSGSGQSYMDKLKAKNIPPMIQEELLEEQTEQEITMVQISTEEWMKLTEAVRRMEALSAELSAVIVFSFWGTAEMGDLVRGALQSIPVIQYESSMTLGFTRWQTYRYVIVPQISRRMIPLSMNLITRMIKTTSLILMIGVVEVLKVAQQIIEANRKSSPNAAFGVFATIFVLYFLACWPISCLAGYLEKRWACE